MTPLRLCLWSGPRNVSTALMYSFAQRSDTQVVDEPLYAHYLRVSGADHPGRDTVLASQDQDGARVVRDVILGPSERSLVFVKQMAHHLVDLDLGFLEQTTHAFLIRDPEEMLPSLVNQIPEPTLHDTGLKVQRDLREKLRAMGQEPPVLDSRELLLHPKAVLEELCSRLGVDFQEGMLSWEMGARPEDGAWASHWYHNVHRSTTFQPYKKKSARFPERLQTLLEECRPHYEALYASAIKAPAGSAEA